MTSMTTAKGRDISSNATMDTTKTAQSKNSTTKPDTTIVPIGKLADIKKEIDMDEHKIPLEELCKRLDTNIETGLNAEQVKQKRQKFGRNQLTPPKKPSKWWKLLQTLFAGFSIILWISVLLCFGAFAYETFSEDGNADDAQAHMWLGIVLMFSILISAAFDFYQNSKSEKIMESFGKMIPLKAVVRREGVMQEVKVSDLVPGDIVEVKGGNSIPADIRIFLCNGLKVDNSSLTGESEPQDRGTRCTNKKEPLHTANMAFFSTNAVEGNAQGLVVRTGDATVMGEIAALTSSMDETVTPLTKEINNFVYIITVVSLCLATAVFATALVVKYPFMKAAMLFMGVVVGNVPQGLLVTVTVCLMLIARKMSKNNCLVKNLHAVETLGSTSVICTDKTGTITLNRMTCSHFWHDRSWMTFRPTEMDMVDEHGHDESEMDEGRLKTRHALLRAAALCNRSELEPGQDNLPIRERKCTSDATESALFRCVEALTGSVSSWREKNRKCFEIPFNSVQKFQLSIHACDDPSDGYFLVAKGAPEIIMDMCSTIIVEGEEVALDDEIRAEFNQAYEFFGGYGERVLGFCDFDLDTESYPPGFAFDLEKLNFPANGLRFIGLVSLIDPPRASVPGAVAKCRTAGIKVVMVTGDHPSTAKAIAKAAGIITTETRQDVALRNNSSLEEVDPAEVKAAVLEGYDLKKMTDEQLDKFLMHHQEIVFARTSPKQKLRIVEGFQRGGAIVAVTGDGVNDSPALRKADVGIAMGITGSDVSKQVADIILLDDNFASIVTGVEAGRMVFDNLKKSIVYTLTSKVPEILPFVLFVILGIPLALGTVTILCIDLGTDLWPAISLAYEKAEPDIMRRPPRNLKRDRLVNARLIAVAYGQVGLLQACAGFFAYFVVMAHNGFLPWQLIGIRNEWACDEMLRNNIHNCELVPDSYGRMWNYANRKILEETCHTAYFFAIVVLQWADLIISKTRRSSVVQQGMSNWVLNSAIVFMTVISVVLSMTPISHAVRMQPLKFQWWLPAIPYAILLFCWDEMRKTFIRHGGSIGEFLEEQTYY